MNEFAHYNDRRFKIFYRIFIFEFILLFLGVFISHSNYGLYLVSYFALIFNSYLLTHFLLSKYRYNKVAVIVFIYSLFSCFMGLINSWELKDILGDTARFLAPFLAYTLGMMLLKNIDLNKFKKALHNIIRILILFVAINFLIKLYKLLILNEPLVSYPSGGIDVETFLFGYCLIMLGSRRVSKVERLLYFCIIIFFVTDPILSMSKSGLLVLLTVVSFYILKISNIKIRIISISFIGIILIYLNHLGINFAVFERFNSALTILADLQNTDGAKDWSTFARIVETRAAIAGLEASYFYPFSYLFGLGSGAVWFSSEFLGHGLAAENYRASGGVHHIHIEIVSLLHRHGLIGLAMYILLLFQTFRMSLSSGRFFKQNDWEMYAVMVAIALCCVSSATYMLTDTSIYGHFKIGLLAAVARTFHKYARQKVVN